MKKQKAKSKTTKKRNYKANEATFINIDALKERVKNLELKMKHIYKVCFSE